MGYKNAFRCKACPESNGPEGCPGWLELPKMEGAIPVIVKDCGFQLFPKIMLESAANPQAQFLVDTLQKHLGSQ